MRVLVTDLGGSLNQGRAVSELQPNEYADISNFFQHGGKLLRRGGMKRLSSNALGQRITGIISYRTATGVKVIVMGPTAAAFLGGDSGDKWIGIPYASGFTTNNVNDLWCLFEYKRIGYGVRAGIPSGVDVPGGIGGFARFDGTSVIPAGIAAPASAPTLAEGAAGAIPAGTFKGVYTFYNTATDLESNPSPVSNALSLGVNKKIDWSGVAVSANGQVNARRLYRSLAGQTGEYFFVAQIDNNTDTTYVGDNVLVDALGRRVSFKNGLPPPNLRIGTVWKERLFASDGRSLFFSEDGLVEAFDPDSEIPVFPDDEHEIRALRPWGDRLAIGKTDSVHYLLGTDPKDFTLQTLTDRHGCVAHHTMQVAEGVLLWLGFDDVYRSTGSGVTGLASVKLRSILRDVDETALRYSFATVIPRFGVYVLVIPGYARLVYNYRTDVWTRVATAANIYSFGDVSDANFEPETYAGDAAGHIYRFNDLAYGYDDSDAVLGAAITASFRGKAFGAEATTGHVITRAHLLCSQLNESITLAIISEGATIKSRTVSLNYVPRWKQYLLSTRHRVRSQSQLQATYTGASFLELEGYGLDMEPVGRPSMRPK